MPKIVDNLDGVPEDYHSFYIEVTDGENKGKFQLEDVSSLKNSLTHAKNERNQAKTKLKGLEGFSTLGKTPEEIQAILEAHEAAETDKLKKSGDHEAILNQHKQNWDKEKGTLAGQVDFWQNLYKNSYIDGNVSSELAKAEATTEGLELLPSILRGRVQIEVEDGKAKTRILAADGTAMAGSGADGFATFTDLVKDAKAKFPSLFKGIGGSGSGASHGKGPGGAQSDKKRSEMSIAEKTAFIRDHGKEAYDALPR